MTKTTQWRNWATAGAAASLLAGAAWFGLDTASNAATNRSARDLFDPGKLAQARCAGGGQMPAGPVMAMAKLPWIGDRFAKPDATDVPLWEGTGTYSMPITTASPEAQKYFDQGLRLTYGFNHYEAIRSFKKAQALDPTCAMCFWGESLALGPNINMAMQPPATAPAWAALVKAQELAGSATPKEQALIKALATRYVAEPPADRNPLDRAYATAMAEVAGAYPDDADVLALYAESMMDITPWDYWEPGGVQPHEAQAALVPTLEKALAINANHLGALHLHIHAVEATPTPERAEPIADRLYPLMPAAGHMVHMPAHIYMRVGRIEDAKRINIEAMEADEAYFKSVDVPAFDVYKIGYYPHNVHFVLVNSQLTGDAENLDKAAAKLPTLIPDDAARAALLVQPIKTSALLMLAHMGETEKVMAYPKPADDLPYLVAMWHYARGIVMTGNGDAAGAEAELSEIQRISDSGALFKLEQTIVPAEILGEISIEVLNARIAQAKGDRASAIAHFREAAELQEQVPYTEPPFWYYPIKQSLGGLLLADGKAQEAADVFSASLLDQPGNAWALYGLYKSYEALGDQAAAAETKKHFDAEWLGPQDIDIERM